MKGGHAFYPGMAIVVALDLPAQLTAIQGLRWALPKSLSQEIEAENLLMWVVRRHLPPSPAGWKTEIGRAHV